MNEQTRHTRQFIRTSVVLVVLVALITLGLAWRQGAFEDRLLLRFTTDTGASLSKGMPVKYQGFRIGQLRSFELQPDASITGEVEINERHRAFATQGASLRLGQDNFVTSELVLQPRKDERTPLKSGDTVVLERRAAVADLEKKVMDKIDPALQQLTHLLATLTNDKTGLPATVGTLNKTLEQANKTLATLNQKLTDPRMDSLLGNADKVVGNLKTGTDRLGQTLESADKLLVTSEKTIQSLQGTLQTVEGTLKHTQGALMGTNQELTGVLKQSHRLIGDGADLIEDFRGSTLGRWLAPRREAAQPKPEQAKPAP